MGEIILRVNKKEDLDVVLQLAEEVFKPNKEEKQKYHKKSDWQEKLDNGLLVSAFVGEKIVGFAICYKKENDLHVWNVGVLEEYRKNGIWRMMFEEVMKFAKNKQFKTLSLNTYKEKFPGMYNFCKSESFVEYATEFDSLSGCTKSKFSKKL
jgi:ribosomal protein S18 acetylase RimI-like enzyme